MAAVLQVIAEVGGDVGVVFDHEDAHSVSCWAGGAPLGDSCTRLRECTAAGRWMQCGRAITGKKEAQARNPRLGQSIAPITEICGVDGGT
jgi:hypothetical protein